MTGAPQLQSRLRSCLQAILDMEPQLENLNMAEALLAEFVALKEIYGRLDSLCVKEDDVKRIEEATAHFLKELEGTVDADVSLTRDSRLLQ